MKPTSGMLVLPEQTQRTWEEHNRDDLESQKQFYTGGQPYPQDLSNEASVTQILPKGGPNRINRCILQGSPFGRSLLIRGYPKVHFTIHHRSDRESHLINVCMDDWSPLFSGHLTRTNDNMPDQSLSQSSEMPSG